MRTAKRMGLRTVAGIDLDSFAERYGVDLLAANEALVARLEAEGRLAHIAVHEHDEGSFVGMMQRGREYLMVRQAARGQPA